MKLIFVYNADSGMFNTLTDIAHKMLSPKTYQCNLCQLTHGVFSVRDEWLSFLAELEVDIDFMHRDEFMQSEYALEADLPAIFSLEGGRVSIWMDQAEINSLPSTDRLKQAIRGKLQSSS